MFKRFFIGFAWIVLLYWGGFAQEQIQFLKSQKALNIFNMTGWE